MKKHFADRLNHPLYGDSCLNIIQNVLATRYTLDKQGIYQKNVNRKSILRKTTHGQSLQPASNASR